MGVAEQGHMQIREDKRKERRRKRKGGRECEKEITGTPLKSSPNQWQWD